MTVTFFLLHIWVYVLKDVIADIYWIETDLSNFFSLIFIVPSGIIKTILFHMAALQKLEANPDASAKSLIFQDEHEQNNPARESNFLILKTFSILVSLLPTYWF